MLLRAARVVDGRGGCHEDVRVRIDTETGTIDAVGDPTPRDGERVVDLDGRTVLPGLVDAHVHYSLSGEPSIEDVNGSSDAELALVEAANARRALEGGVTAVRDMGAQDVDPAVREAIARGDLPGPRTVANCRSITITGGHGYHMGREVDGPDACRRAVREEVKKGADFVKFMTTGGVTTPGSSPRGLAFTHEEIAAIVDEAHRRGVHAATHAHGAAGVEAAAEAGVDTVEHGTFLDDDAIDALLAADATLVPTLSAGYRIVRNADRVEKEAADKAAEVNERHVESFRRAHEAGVTIAGGTDAGTPFNHHGDNAREIEFMHVNGMDAIEAITAMTARAAETIGLDDCGVVEAGANADLLVVDGDPLDDLGLLGDPAAVLQDGAVVAGSLPS